jgi:hypothetical protein
MSACICAYCEGGTLSLGISLINTNGEPASFWGPALPHSLVQSWRSSHILDQIVHIQPDILSSCYYAGTRELHSSEQHHLDRLSNQLNIHQLRTELLARPIPDEELDAMLNICNNPNSGIELDIHELKQELELGVINPTDELEQAFGLHENGMAQYVENMRRSKTPLPPDQSFAQFCRDFKIKNLCELPRGKYGRDWSHYDLDKLDEQIIFDSLQYRKPCAIYRSSRVKTSRNFGDIGHPILRIEGDTHLIPVSVRYHDNAILVSIVDLMDTNNQYELTIPELRRLRPRMIGTTISLAGGEPLNGGERQNPALIEEVIPSILRWVFR